MGTGPGVGSGKAAGGSAPLENDRSRVPVEAAVHRLALAAAYFREAGGDPSQYQAIGRADTELWWSFGVTPASQHRVVGWQQGCNVARFGPFSQPSWDWEQQKSKRDAFSSRTEGTAVGTFNQDERERGKDWGVDPNAAFRSPYPQHTGSTALSCSSR